MKTTPLTKTFGITAGALSLTLLFAHGVSRDQVSKLCARYQPAPDLQGCISKSSGGKILDEAKRSFAKAILKGLGTNKVKTCICITEGGQFCWTFDPVTGEFKGKVTDDLYTTVEGYVAFIFADTPASTTTPTGMASNKKAGVSKPPVGVVKKLAATKRTNTTTKIPNPRNRTSRHEGTGRQTA